ncbi:MAG: hypothetical protein EOM32_09660 [Spirochaetia bacterium]|nr:hypothetical protein [Spirochaetia bacterium]
MTEDTMREQLLQIIGDGATRIAQAYAQFGNLSALLLGQTSSALQLGLFRPLALELALYLTYLMESKENRQISLVLDETQQMAEEAGYEAVEFTEETRESYRVAEDAHQLFCSRCQNVIATDPLWLSTQARKTTPQASISDPGYIAIMQVAKELEALASEPD